MAEELTKRRSHKRLWIGAAAGVVLLAIFVSAAWYLRSPSFADYVRRKLIVTLEDATGGRVEIASFHWNLSQLAFEADGLTIHGLEPADQLPYAHVDRVMVRLHIISLFERRFSLEQLELQRPVIHVIVYADGTSNAPQPKVEQAVNAEPVQQLFDLAIARTDVRDGMLLLNDRKLPLDFAANDVVAAMTYDAAAQRYNGNVQAGKIDVKYQDYRDIPARADLQFTLLHNAAEISSLKLTSQESSLQLAGKVTDFQNPNPKIQLTYDGMISAAQLGAITREPQLRGGTVLLDGSASYSGATTFATTGRIAVRDLDYQDGSIVLRKANLNSNFSASDDHLALTRIAARLLGGQVNGDADIRNFISGLAPAGPVNPQAIVSVGKKGPAQPAQPQRVVTAAGVPSQQGSARLRVAGLSLNELARLMSSRSLPLEKLNPVGSVTGSVNLAWKGSLADAFADLALDIAAPEQSSTNGLPVGGDVRGRYSVRSARIELANLNLTTPHSHVEATGTVSDTTAALKVNVNTSSLTEFQPMLTAMGNPPLPIELAGSASFNGSLNGRLRTPQIAGHLQASNFTYIYTPALNAAPPQKPQPPAKQKSFFHLAKTPEPAPKFEPVTQARRIHIDSFSADVQYSQSEVALHHAVVQEAGAQLNLDGSSALEKGNFTDNSQRTGWFRMQVSLRRE